jgi:chemotaxis family two-component system response regulator Rcp1
MTPETPQAGRVFVRRAEILHVEDSAADAELLRDTLSDFPELTVARAADGAEALAYPRDGRGNGGPRRPDLIVLDFDLPRVDGRRVLAEVRRDPALRVIPVVVLSGSPLHEDRVLSYELGANAYVVKPGELQQYRAVIRAICEFWCGAAALPLRP